MILRACDNNDNVKIGNDDDYEVLMNVIDNLKKKHDKETDSDINDCKSSASASRLTEQITHKRTHTKNEKRIFNKLLIALEQFYDKKYPNIGSQLSKQNILNLCKKEICDLIIVQKVQESKIVSLQYAIKKILREHNNNDNFVIGNDDDSVLLKESIGIKSLKPKSVTIINKETISTARGTSKNKSSHVDNNDHNKKNNNALNKSYSTGCGRKLISNKSVILQHYNKLKNYKTLSHQFSPHSRTRGGKVYSCSGNKNYYNFNKNRYDNNNSLHSKKSNDHPGCVVMAAAVNRGNSFAKDTNMMIDRKENTSENKNFIIIPLFEENIFKLLNYNSKNASRLNNFLVEANKFYSQLNDININNNLHENDLPFDTFNLILNERDNNIMNLSSNGKSLNAQKHVNTKK